MPFIIRGPGLKPGVRIPYQAAHVDIAPTLLALAGAKVSSLVELTRCSPFFSFRWGVSGVR